jgi:hypothetical protein
MHEKGGHEICFWVREAHKKFFHSLIWARFFTTISRIENFNLPFFCRRKFRSRDSAFIYVIISGKSNSNNE